METKIINNRYELIACTAVATEAGDTEEQSAILCRDMDACLGDAFCVYFGYTLDELADSIEEIRGIVAALKRRDAGAAAEACRQHVDNAAVAALNLNRRTA